MRLQRWNLATATACLLAAGACGGGVPNAPSPVEPTFITYEGSVFEPLGDCCVFGEGGVTGIPEVRVTIIGGQVDGWRTVTDAEGRFAFEDYPECAVDSAECRSRVFRVEKARYVTVEERASDPHLYWGPDHGNPQHSTSEKHIPMSREWPTDAQIQRMLRDLPAMDPLWLVVRPDGDYRGLYIGGVVVTRSLGLLGTIAHEYCHAHQDWVVDPNGYGGISERWPNTPEGSAFVEAWDAERATNNPALTTVSTGYDRDNYVEFAAVTCSSYFVEGDVSSGRRPGPEELQDRLPHLYAWAEEWLRHR